MVRISEQTNLRLTADGRQPTYITVILVDVAALRAAQRGVPGAVTLPRSLERASGNAAGPAFGDFTGARSRLEIGGHQLQVVGTPPRRAP